jgi:hypothetical protein
MHHLSYKIYLIFGNELVCRKCVLEEKTNLCLLLEGNFKIGDL